MIQFARCTHAGPVKAIEIISVTGNKWSVNHHFPKTYVEAQIYCDMRNIYLCDRHTFNRIHDGMCGLVNGDKELFTKSIIKRYKDDRSRKSQQNQ